MHGAIEFAEVIRSQGNMTVSGNRKGSGDFDIARETAVQRNLLIG